MSTVAWHDSLPKPESSPDRISVQKLKDWIDSDGRDYIIVDTRRADIDDLPYMIPGAINLPAHTFYQTLPTTCPILSRYKKVIFHCSSSNGRGPRCAAWYQDRLDSDAHKESVSLVLSGGIKEWLDTYPSIVLHI